MDFKVMIMAKSEEVIESVSEALVATRDLKEQAHAREDVRWTPAGEQQKGEDLKIARKLQKQSAKLAPPESPEHGGLLMLTKLPPPKPPDYDTGTGITAEMVPPPGPASSGATARTHVATQFKLSYAPPQVPPTEPSGPLSGVVAISNAKAKSNTKALAESGLHEYDVKETRCGNVSFLPPLEPPNTKVAATVTAEESPEMAARRTVTGGDVCEKKKGEEHTTVEEFLVSRVLTQLPPPKPPKSPPCMEGSGMTTKEMLPIAAPIHSSGCKEKEEERGVSSRARQESGHVCHLMGQAQISGHNNWGYGERVCDMKLLDRAQNEDWSAGEGIILMRLISKAQKDEVAQAVCIFMIGLPELKSFSAQPLGVGATYGSSVKEILYLTPSNPDSERTEDARNENAGMVRDAIAGIVEQQRGVSKEAMSLLGACQRHLLAFQKGMKTESRSDGAKGRAVLLTSNSFIGWMSTSNYLITANSASAIFDMYMMVQASYSDKSYIKRYELDLHIGVMVRFSLISKNPLEFLWAGPPKETGKIRVLGRCQETKNAVIEHNSEEDKQDVQGVKFYAPTVIPFTVNEVELEFLRRGLEHFNFICNYSLDPLLLGFLKETGRIKSQGKGSENSCALAKQNGDRHTGDALSLQGASYKIERNLMLLSATAVDCKFQNGVPDCIDKLTQAGILIWALIGDKMETRIKGGFAYSQPRQRLQQMLIYLETPDIQPLQIGGDEASMLCEQENYLLLISENQESLGIRLGSDPWDPGGHYNNASSLSFFLKIWDPGGSSLFFSTMVFPFHTSP